MFRFERREIRTIALLTGLGAGLRLVGLGSHELGLNEAWRIVWAVEPDASLAQAAIGNVGAAFHAWLLRHLYPLATSPLLIRLPAATAGIACVPLYYGFCRTLSSRKIALVASLILTFAPLPLLFSRAAEPYIFLLLFAIVGTALSCEIMRNPARIPRLAPWIALVEVSGLLTGGYWILPYWAALGLVVSQQIARELTPKQWALLLLAQLPLLLAFWHSISVGMMAPGETAHLYSVYIKKLNFDYHRFAPADILVDLVSFVGIWVVWKPAPLWLLVSENILGGFLVWLALRGHRTLQSNQGPAGALPGRALFLTPLLMALVFLWRFGSIHYGARAYICLVVPLFVLLAQGILESRLWVRVLAIGIFGTLTAASAAAIFLNRHPADPPHLASILHLARERVGSEGVLYAHPGELAWLFRVADMPDTVRVAGVWRDDYPTFDSIPLMTRKMPQAALREWIQKIASERTCVVNVATEGQWRDPKQELRRALREDYGYTDTPIGWAVSFLCPPALSGP